MTYRVAIIGLSGIAANPHQPGPDPSVGIKAPYSVAGGFALQPRCEVVGVCDLIPELFDVFKERWAFRWPNVKTYTDYKLMLAEQKPDIVAVVTPDHRHANMVVDAAGAGAKAILCEKPIATTLEDADRMIAACRETRALLTIDHTRRWVPHYQEAKRLVREGAIGNVTQIVTFLGGTRSMIFRNGTHLMDLLCWFADGDPDWVSAELEPSMHDYGPVYAGDGGKKPETDPGGNLYIVFKNGVRGYFCAMKNMVPVSETTVVGDKGYLRISDRNAEVHSFEDGVFNGRHLPYLYTTQASIGGCVADLIQCLETGRRVASPPEEARRALSAILAGLESQAKGNVRVACR